MGENAEKLIKEKINVHRVAAHFIDAFNFVSQQKFNLKYLFEL